nr:hypothetical protein [Cylindrotheca closterium]ULD16252.1 hypothetical protein [Cylindrotheca closterium]
MFLKFIGFTKNLDCEIQKLDSIDYQVIVFRVKDFTDECDSLFKSSDNSYKVKQVKLMLLQHNHNIRVVLVIVQVSLVVDQVQDQENQMVTVQMDTEMTAVFQNTLKQNQSKKQKNELKKLTTTFAKCAR